jgi:hypothetical protein
LAATLVEALWRACTHFRVPKIYIIVPLAFYAGALSAYFVSNDRQLHLNWLTQQNVALELCKYAEPGRVLVVTDTAPIERPSPGDVFSWTFPNVLELMFVDPSITAKQVIGVRGASLPVNDSPASVSKTLVFRAVYRGIDTVDPVMPQPVHSQTDCRLALREFG